MRRGGMHQDADCLPRAIGGGATGRHQRFLECLVTFMALGVLAFLALLYVLGAIGSLPPPPITATYCIDEKFKFLAEQRDLKDSDLLAVGSSVTWRNLDMAPLAARGVAQRPLNAAPCYLHLDQIAFLTGFLLDHLDRVKVVVSVVAPRDFADCKEADRAFFSPEKAAPYLFEGASPLSIYATNFRPIPFLRDAWHIAEKRSSPRAFGPLVMDAYGAGPIEGTGNWNPAPTFDERCFEALAEFEDMLDDRGVRLVLVSFPTSPEWRAQYDPQGEVTRRFEAQLRHALSDGDSLFAPSEAFSFESAAYFDYVHLQWPAARQFSARVTDWLAERRVATSGG